MSPCNTCEINRDAYLATPQRHPTGNEAASCAAGTRELPKPARDHPPIVSRYTDAVREDTRAMTQTFARAPECRGKSWRFGRSALACMAPRGNPCNVQVGTFH